MAMFGPGFESAWLLDPRASNAVAPAGATVGGPGFFSRLMSGFGGAGAQGAAAAGGPQLNPNAKLAGNLGMLAGIAGQAAQARDPNSVGGAIGTAAAGFAKNYVQGSAANQVATQADKNYADIQQQQLKALNPVAGFQMASQAANPYVNMANPMVFSPVQQTQPAPQTAPVIQPPATPPVPQPAAPGVPQGPFVPSPAGSTVGSTPAGQSNPTQTNPYLMAASGEADRYISGMPNPMLVPVTIPAQFNNVQVPVSPFISLQDRASMLAQGMVGPEFSEQSNVNLADRALRQNNQALDMARTAEIMRNNALNRQQVAQGMEQTALDIANYQTPAQKMQDTIKAAQEEANIKLASDKALADYYTKLGFSPTGTAVGVGRETTEERKAAENAAAKAMAMDPDRALDKDELASIDKTVEGSIEANAEYQELKGYVREFGLDRTDDAKWKSLSPEEQNARIEFKKQIDTRIGEIKQVNRDIATIDHTIRNRDLTKGGSLGVNEGKYLNPSTIDGVKYITALARNSGKPYRFMWKGVEILVDKEGKSYIVGEDKGGAQQDIENKKALGTGGTRNAIKLRVDDMRNRGGNNRWQIQ